MTEVIVLFNNANSIHLRNWYKLLNCISWANGSADIAKSAGPSFNEICIFNINNGLFWAK